MSFSSISKQKSKTISEISNFFIIVPIICILLIGISIFANKKEKESILESNIISNELDTLKIQESKLKATNDALIESKNNIEILLEELK